MGGKLRRGVWGHAFKSGRGGNCPPSPTPLNLIEGALSEPGLNPLMLPGLFLLHPERGNQPGDKVRVKDRWLNENMVLPTTKVVSTGKISH